MENGKKHPLELMKARLEQDILWKETCKDVSWMKTLGMNGSETLTECAGKEQYWQQQQVFMMGVEGEMEKLEMFRNKISVHVLHKCVGFRPHGRIDGD